MTKKASQRKRAVVQSLVRTKKKSQPGLKSPHTKATDDEFKTNESLVSIHQRFLKNLDRFSFPKDNNDNEDLHKLLRLKRRRMALAAELQAIRQNEITTVEQDLREQQRFRQLVGQRPYLRGLHHGNDATLDVKPCLVDDEAALQEQSQQSVFHRLRQAREESKIAAVARLIGRSLTFSCLDNEESNVLGLRIDVSAHGVYLTNHHVLFELVNKLSEDVDDDDDKKNRWGNPHALQANQPQRRTYLQFKEHTLPASIDWMDVLERNLGHSLCVGPLDDGGDFEQVAIHLRACSEELQRLCYAFGVRQEAVWFLRQKWHNPRDDDKYSVQHVESKKSFQLITFDLRLGQQKYWKLTLKIELHYTDPSVSQPTEVKASLKIATQSLTSRRASSDVVSDDEEDGTENKKLIVLAESLFREHSVSKAIDELVTQQEVLRIRDGSQQSDSDS